jgi:hypothetical protein
VMSALGLRYLALALVKLIPVIGWAVSGVLCVLMTFMVGEAAIRYYEAGGSLWPKAFWQTGRSRWQAWRGERRAARQQRTQRRRWLRARPSTDEWAEEDELIIPVSEVVDEMEGAR